MNYTSQDQEDSLKPLIDIYALHDFLQVSEPDRVFKNAFIHDLQGNPIDCNIYHPKYGYQGFLTYDERLIVTSFNPNYGYKCLLTHQYIYSPYNSFNLTCIYEDGRLTNKDGIEVEFTDFVMHNQTRLAREEDFEEIWKYWLIEKNLDPLSESIAGLRKFLIDKTMSLQKLHEESADDKQLDLNLTALSEIFIKFLTSKKTPQEEEAKRNEGEKDFDLKQESSAAVKGSKKVKRCLFNSLSIAIAVTMVNDINGMFVKTISKTDTTIINKFLKDIEEKFKIKNVPERVVRQFNKLIICEDFFQKLSDPDKESVKKILELGGYSKVLKGIK